MADKQISQLTSAQEVRDPDLFVLEQDGIAKKLLGATFKAYFTPIVSRAEEAARSAELAKEESARNAESAGESRDSANTSAEIASDKAELAARSAESADSSEQSAAESADEARISREQAEEAMTSAEAARDASNTSASEAAESASMAGALASASQEAAAAAIDSAGEAAASASLASGSADAATESAQAAELSATAAEAAQTAAETAQSAAEAAESGAEAAQTAAETAQSAAEAAQTAAESAQGAAETAQAAAEDAQSDAEASALAAAGSAESASGSAAAAAGSASAASGSETAARAAQTAAENAQEATESARDDVSEMVDRMGNVPVVKGNSFTATGTSVTQTLNKVNVKTGVETSETVPMPIANGESAGLMTPEQVAAIEGLESRVGGLENQNVRLSYTASGTPTESEIRAFVLAAGYTDTTKWASIGVVVSATNHIWRYYANTATWTDIGIDTVQQASQSVKGIVLGSSTAGKVFVEADGTMSVIGFDALTSGIENLESGKQDTISDLSTIRSGAAAGATAYQKPSGGVPKSDLAAAVQTSLGLADSALQSVPSTYRTATAQDTIDAGKLGTSGNGSNVTVAFTQAASRTNISTGEKLSVLFGKISRWFADLKTVAFSGSYNDLSNKPTIPAAQVQSDWNATSGMGAILNKPTIPTRLSQLSGDSTHRTVTDTEKSTWNGKQAALVSGTNIKSINNQSILGSGNLTVREVPSYSTSDNRKFLRMVDGAPAWVSLSVMEGGSY